MDIGLDLHKEFIQVVKIKNASSPVIESFKIATTFEAITAFAKSLNSKDRVVMESCTNTYIIAQILINNGVNVTISNPIKTKMIADSKIKTDKVDAEALARLLACGYIPTVWQPTEDIEELRKLTAFFGAVTSQRTVIKHRINSVLGRNLIDYKKNLFNSVGRKFIEKVQLPEDEKLRIGMELELLDFLDEKIKKIKEQMAKKALVDEDIKRLMTIPGIDFISAMYLKASIGDIKRFISPKKLVCYLGLNPRVYQSGKSCHIGKISKKGCATARFTLVQASHQAARVPGPLRSFFMRVKRRSGKNKALVAVASKIARIIWIMSVKQEDYRFAPPLMIQEKMARLRIIATGVRLKGGRKKKGEITKGGKKGYQEAREHDYDNAIIGEQVYENEVNRKSGNLVEIA